MNFYGQQKILRELQYLLPEIQSGRNISILLSAPSGHGKTTLAYYILNILGWNDSQISMPPNFPYDSSKRVHFFDEAHMLENVEALYEIMDAGSNVILLATNETGLLKEPVVNRCIPLIFEPYSEDDIFYIVRDCMAEFNLSDEMLRGIVTRSKLNPRIAKTTSMRLQYIFRQGGVPKTISDLDNIIFDILNIDPSGLNPVDRTYINCLKNSNGRASLSMIAHSTHIDKATILRDIEPHLIYLGLIQIGPRGRILTAKGERL